MKIYSLLFMASMFFNVIATAQVNKLSKQNIPGVANATKLLTEFVNAVKPSSFTDAWSGQKDEWIGKALKISSAAGFTNSISSLAGLVQPGMFKQGFNVQNILQTANMVKTMSDVAGLLKVFEDGFKPEAFASGWTKQRSGWLSALNLLIG